MNIPKGFRLAVASAGFKKPGRNDLALLCSDTPATVAAMFTQAAFKAAPVLVAQEAVARHARARAVVINTGQANACTGGEGMANCRKTLECIARATGMRAEEILPASTGVIGAQLKMDRYEQAVPALAAALGAASLEDFARAIMTTDAFPKFASEDVELSGGRARLAGAAKGAGMICPNMATMICAVMCDAAVDHAAWRSMFARAVDATFNRVTVDGDTSTNDAIFGLANGASGIRASSGADLALLEKTLTGMLGKLAYMLVQDGEGATKVMRIRVCGANNDEDAEKVARTVGHSQLVKTAMYGKDANWGRIVAAVGRSYVPFAPKDLRVSLCGVPLFADEQPVGGNVDELLREPLQHRDLDMDIVLGGGPGAYTLLASDLTHEYISVNADYRS